MSPTHPSRPLKKRTEVVTNGREESAPTQTYLARTSTEFQGSYQQLGQLVRRIFPDAEEGMHGGIPGWRARRKVPPPASWRGTIDWQYVLVLLRDGKAGPSLHLINPADPGGLMKWKAELETEGFRARRACLEYHRKGPLPLEAVGRLLVHIKALAHA